MATLRQRIPLAVRMIAYGISFLAFLLGALPWLAYRVDVLAPGWHVEIGWFRVVGVVVFVGGAAGYVRSSYLLTHLGRGAYVEIDPPREFVATGPYRWMRNPIAACAVFMLLGEALMLSSTGILLLSLTGMLVAHGQVIFLEERLLRRRFGSSYAEYLRRVPRWLPRRPKGGSP